MSAQTTGTSVAISSHIAIIDGKPTTTTHDIAEVYGRRHEYVMKIVRQRMVECPEDWRIPNFWETVSERPNPSGGAPIKSPVIRMTKKGFHFVVGKFTGAKAVQHQIAFADEFERMEAALLAQHPPVASLAPYSVHAGQTLSEDQAHTLRTLLDDFVKTLPKEKQGGFMVKGWAKLKAHFNCGYREIPADKFTDAVSIIARHIVEYSTPELPAPEPKQEGMDFSFLSLKNKRLLLSYDHNGKELIQRVPNEAMLVTWQEVAHILREHYLMVSLPQITEIINAGCDAIVKRMQGKMIAA